MSNLEQQRRALRQEWPERSVSGGGQIPALTPEQRAAAHHADALADTLLPILDGGKKWFTAYDVREQRAGTLLHDLERVGIITKHKSTNHDGYYYKPTNLTRPFLLTALALRDERIKAMQERADAGA
jgi:hypothetical protein